MDMVIDNLTAMQSDRARYKQVKISVDSDIAEAFKARCAAANVSMASEIKGFMQARHPEKVKASTRPLRRKAVTEIIDSLNLILGAEEVYRDNIPEEFTQRYDVAEHACSQLSEAIACLEDAF